MSLSVLETFKSLFMELQPKDYHKWQEERDLDRVSTKIKTGGEMLGELRGDSIVQPLAEVRKKVDQLQFTMLHMIPRWQETEASKVKVAIGSVQKAVDQIKKEVTTAEGDLSWKFWRPEEQQKQLDEVNSDIKGIEDTLERELKELDKRGSLKIGEGSDFVDHGLKQGWVSDPKGEGTFQYQSEEERQHLKDRGTNQTLVTEDMQVLSEGKNKVHLRKDQSLVEGQQRLETERETSVKLRNEMSDTYKKRLEHDGPVKDGVVNNINMANKLASLLQDDQDSKDLLGKHIIKVVDKQGKPVIDTKTNNQKEIEEGGILSRVIGPIEGQGQFPDKNKPGDIADGIGTISENLKKGTFQPGDANKIQQFISGFVDGLTEVNETNETAQKQFDALWEKMQKAFGLDKEDKAKLMERVDVYKKLAGGLSDTGPSGKAVRKGFTRSGKMTTGDNTIDDPEALIANDISGSMHSQFLAMEIAESLSGNATDELGQPIKKNKDGESVPGFKTAGASVQVKDKDVLNARMVDALALTAGGKFPDGKDFVMHTAYEMINGVQAMTGVANKVTQKTATAVMKSIQDGKSFSDAMEEALPNEVFPWQLPDAGKVNERATKALEEARKPSTNGTEAERVTEAVKKLVEDVLWMATDLDGPSNEDVEKIEKKLEEGAALTAAIKDYFKKATFPWG